MAFAKAKYILLTAPSAEEEDEEKEERLRQIEQTTEAKQAGIISILILLFTYASLVIQCVLCYKYLLSGRIHRTYDMVVIWLGVIGQPITLIAICCVMCKGFMQLIPDADASSDEDASSH